jgi:hypothetical protein
MDPAPTQTKKREIATYPVLVIATRHRKMGVHRTPDGLEAMLLETARVAAGAE